MTEFDPKKWVNSPNDKRISSMMGHYSEHGWTVEQFAEKVREFLPHVVSYECKRGTADWFKDFGEKLKREEWCDKHCTGYWTNSVFVRTEEERTQFFFQLAEDAILFKLTCS